MRLASSLIITVFLFILIACPAPPPDPPDAVRDTRIYIEIIDLWTTSITLKISVADTTQSWGFALSKDDSIILETVAFGRDTSIVDDGLIPSTDYSYKVYFIGEAELQDSSQAFNATTMDTTSHSFNWEIDTLGIYGSYLNDVAIISEDNIWVVGNIETDSMQYNAAHWDGGEWEYLKILSGNSAVSTICYFSQNDIWTSIGSFPVYWDGTDWTLYHLQEMGLDVHTINSSWGTSSSNMYFVGDGGSIVHFNGTEFMKMESGTEINLIDITGTVDEQHVFVCGTRNNNPQGSVIMELVDNNWETIYFSEPLLPADNCGWAYTISVCQDTLYSATMAGLWKYNYLDSGFDLYSKENHNNSFFFTTFRRSFVNSVADIFLINLNFTIIHFNGVNWAFDDQFLQLFGTSNIYARGADYQDDNLVISGYINGGANAVVARGERNRF